MSQYRDVQDPYVSSYKSDIQENQYSWNNKTFKQRKSFAARKLEAEGIRKLFPSKVPVIVERFNKETNLPKLNKTKFLIPQEFTMSHLLTVIRNRLSLRPSETIYLILGNKHISCMSTTLAEVYRDAKDEDGFLYATYVSQEMFGSVQ